MYPRLLNSSNEVLAVLDNITSGKVKEVINGEFTFSFSAVEKELKSEFFVDGNKVEVDDQYFDIVAIDKVHKIKVDYTIECEHAAYDLINTKLDEQTLTDTPANILTAWLAGTGFTVGSMEFTDVVIVSVPQDTTVRQAIKDLAATLGAEIQYTNKGYTIGLVDEIGQDNGASVIFGKNLLGITRSYDKRESTEFSYSVDISMLKNTNEYIRLGLSSLEVYNVGDLVRVVDNVAGIVTNQRILSRTYDPINEVNTSIEMVNEIKLISDTITSIQTNTATNKTSITALNGKIELVASDVEDNSASIIVESDRIDLNVTGISQNVDGINYNAANITLLSDEIDLKVDADGVINSINISPEGVKIDANRLTITGFVEFNDLTDGVTTISGDNILTGRITAIDMVGSKFYGPSTSSAYVEISNNSFGYADFEMYRQGSSTPEFAIEDKIATIGLYAAGDLALTLDKSATGYAEFPGRLVCGADMIVGDDLDVFDNADIGGHLNVDEYIRLNGDNVVTSSGSGQEVQVQYFSDHLEVREGGGAWKVLPFI